MALRHGARRREAGAIEALAGLATYGRGTIPAKVTLGDTTFKTSLRPKDGTYVVPFEATVRKAERLELGDQAAVRLVIDIWGWGPS